MPIGTSRVATSERIVIDVAETFADGTRKQGEENTQVIQHADGTISKYGHLATMGALVDVLHRSDTLPALQAHLFTPRLWKVQFDADHAQNRVIFLSRFILWLYHAVVCAASHSNRSGADSGLEI